MKWPFVSRSAYEELSRDMAELTAEYQNYRRRTAQEKDAGYLRGKGEAAEKFLPVYDALQLALQNAEENAPMAEGIRMTLQSFLKSLGDLGISEIPAEGCPFDPNIHEAMEHITDPDMGENTVVKVLRAGFTQEEKVLRPALVCVAN